VQIGHQAPDLDVAENLRGEVTEIAPTECAPTDLAPAGLSPVAGLADLDGLVATAADSGLQVTVVHVGGGAAEREPDRRVPVVVDVTAHWIVQESITNVLRHSDSDRAVVEVHYRPTEIRLGISNAESRQLASAVTGRPAAGIGGVATGGFGIAGMRERVELLGGT
jgi:signal transduction histidine kinase